MAKSLDYHGGDPCSIRRADDLCFFCWDSTLSACVGADRETTMNSSEPNAKIKPALVKYDEDLDLSDNHEYDAPDAADTSCGMSRCRPKVLQPCASIGCFTAVYSFAGLMTSTLSIYVNSQVTTLERQFGFTSHQTGIIMAANDIGYLICVLFVSYSASRLHIPRSLGYATMMFGLSGLICCIPHFLFGAKTTMEVSNGSNMTSLASTIAQTPKTKASFYGDLCSLTNLTSSSCETDVSSPEPTSSLEDHVATASLAIIFVGMLLQGFAKAPRSSFTVTYVDDNTEKVNTGMHVGIITTMGIFGPAVAYLMGGFFSKIYVTLEETHIHPKHPKWIGAWWLGYIVFGSMALVIALPLFFFPRTLNKSRVKNNNILRDEDTDCMPGDTTKQQLQAETYTKEAKPKSRWNMQNIIYHVREFLSSLLRLLLNPLYLLLTSSTCFVVFMVSGTSAYSPKYLERMFHLPAYQANYIMAGKTLSAACIGTFIGGYLTKRMKMTPLRGLKFIIFVLIMSCVTSLAGFVFKCDQPEVHLGPESQDSCNDQCHCQDNSYFPICGDDGKTYYSPCFAGCLEVAKGIYTNCTCIPGGGAVSGTCDYSCTHLAPYAVFAALRSLFGTLTIIPKLIVFIRCVGEKDKALAIGSSSFLTSLLGWLLGPIIFGNVIDGICTIWDFKCGVRGRCLLYDNDLFRHKLHGYATTAIACSLLCNILAYVYAKCTKKLDDVGVNGVCDEEDQKTEASTVTSTELSSVKTECNGKELDIFGRDLESGEGDKNNILFTTKA